MTGTVQKRAKRFKESVPPCVLEVITFTASRMGMVLDECLEWFASDSNILERWLSLPKEELIDLMVTTNPNYRGRRLGLTKPCLRFSRIFRNPCMVCKNRSRRTGRK